MDAPAFEICASFSLLEDLAEMADTTYTNVRVCARVHPRICVRNVCIYKVQCTGMNTIMKSEGGEQRGSEKELVYPCHFALEVVVVVAVLAVLAVSVAGLSSQAVTVTTPSSSHHCSSLSFLTSWWKLFLNHQYCRCYPIITCAKPSVWGLVQSIRPQMGDPWPPEIFFICHIIPALDSCRCLWTRDHNSPANLLAATSKPLLSLDIAKFCSRACISNDIVTLPDFGIWEACYMRKRHCLDCQSSFVKCCLSFFLQTWLCWLQKLRSCHYRWRWLQNHEAIGAGNESFIFTGAARIHSQESSGGADMELSLAKLLNTQSVNECLWRC